jgi:hypothetical protein
MSHQSDVTARTAAADTRGMEKAAARPNWPLSVAACLGLVAVVGFGLWMAAVGFLTSEGVYENLEPAERSAGGRVSLLGLVGAAAAVVALAGLAFRSHRWSTLGGYGVVGAGVAALLVGDLWFVEEGQVFVSAIAVSLVGTLAIFAARRMPRASKAS